MWLKFVSYDSFFFHLPSRYHLLHDSPTENPVLYCQSDHSLRWNFVPDGFGFLPSIRLWRKGTEKLFKTQIGKETSYPHFGVVGDPLHQHPPVTDSLLPAIGRDYPSHVPRRTPPRKISPLHYDTGYIINHSHRRGP